MSKQAKIFIGLGVLLFVCLIIWAVRTVPEAPTKVPTTDEPKIMTYENNTISEEKNGKLVWEVTSEEMAVNVDTHDTEMKNITGKFYAEDGREATITADHGTYEEKTKNMALDGNVHAETTDGSALVAEKLTWSETDGKLTATGNAYIKHEDMEARADTIESTNLFHHFKATGKAHIVKGAK